MRAELELGQSSNPWSQDHPAALRKRSAIIAALGVTAATQMAAAAGKKLNGEPLSTQEKSNGQET